MILMKQKYEIITPINGEEILKQIELAARTCYKSEGKIKDGSDIELYKKLVKRGHEAMFEFGYHPIFKVSVADAHNLAEVRIAEICDNIDYDYYSASQLNISCNYYEDVALISGSIRIYRDLIKYYSHIPVVKRITNTLLKTYPITLIEDLIDSKYEYDSNYTLIELFPGEIPTPELIHHMYPTIRFTTNRGVSHELVRHRIPSFAQESTRYCDYSDGHVSFIIPSWLNIEECILPENNVISLVNKAPIEYLNHLSDCEGRYKALINDYKWSPQQARDILPNALKTEINVSANIREWRHIFNQRTANGAHPDMIALMRPLLDDFKSQIPILFDDINY